MVRAVLAFGLLLLTALSGCSDAGNEGEPTPSPPAADACPTVDADSLVAGWTIHGGQWGTVAAMEGHDDVVCGEATDALDHLLSPAGSFSNVLANVSFNMLDGDSGVGLVVNYQDDGNYVIVRYSIREQGWHLFTMADGQREKRGEASVTPPTTNPDVHQWIALSVRSVDGHVTAYDGTTKVIDYDLPAGVSRSGMVGYFLRDEGQAALFDEFSVQPA